MRVVRLRKAFDQKGYRVIACEKQNPKTEEWNEICHIEVHLNADAEDVISTSLVNLLNELLLDGRYVLVPCDPEAHEWKDVD